MIRRLLYALSGRLPCRIISDGATPYLERYYVGTLFGWRFYLHRFVGSDPDRGLHDHPWRRAYSLVLAGWYWEERRYGGTRKVRWFNALTGDTFHRVVLPRDYPSGIPCTRCNSPISCWTLFAHTAGDEKDWGFWRDGFTHPKIGAFAGDIDAALFQPYRYPQEHGEKPAQWWLTAPKGRETPGRIPT